MQFTVGEKERKRNDASGVGAGDGAVALMVELLSVYPTMPESAPLSSYRCGNEVRVWRYTEALAALRQVAARAGDDPSEVGLHLLSIGAVTTLAAGGDVSQRVIQREGRWKPSESSKVYTHNNPEDAGIVSRKLAETGKMGQRQPGRGTVWAEHRSIDATSELGVVNGLLPETACVSAPASRLGGELPDSVSTIGDEKQRPVPRLSYHASGTPPQRRREE